MRQLRRHIITRRKINNALSSGLLCLSDFHHKALENVKGGLSLFPLLSPYSFTVKRPNSASAPTLFTFSPFYLFTFLLLLTSCARMGNPDGGWFDETPPHVLGASPADKATNVKSRKVTIYFDEFIKIDNATEKVIVSPPQIEAPEIRGLGKSIKVELKDSLKANTTYTVDFSDAITDNNEDNPLGNYTYSFSTGDAIDTMEVSGYVVNAQDLEPVKGILVGLYDDMSDSAFKKKPMIRVARTDSRGYFVVKGIAPGRYRVAALADADGDYIYSQRSEQLAFSHDIIIPSSKPDIRQDTIWRDSLRIDSIARVPYTHYLPDDITLRAFTAPLTDRYLVKSERREANRFTLFFSYGSDRLPLIHGLNFDAQKTLLAETTPKQDTITYWITDTALVNRDTLRMEVSYLMTDSMGQLVNRTDTMEILAKTPYARRLKDQKKEYDKWLKDQSKGKKKGEPIDSVMPAKPLTVEIRAKSPLAPDENVRVTMPTPLTVCDTSKIHLYAKHDTLWYQSVFEFVPDTAAPRTYILRGEWRPEIEYSLEIDSAAFVDIYGLASAKSKTGFKVGADGDYSSLFMTITGFAGKPIVVQLQNNQDATVKQVSTSNGTAEFFYITPGTYYVRMFVDANGNGIWDTGDYDKDLQPEEVYYYPHPVECREKWDVTQTWDPLARKAFEQKPGDLVKNKAEKKRTIRSRNLQRAKEKGLKYVPKI